MFFFSGVYMIAALYMLMPLSNPRRKTHETIRTIAVATNSYETQSKHLQHDLRLGIPQARNTSVLICFCFDNELDLLHVKLEMLHKVTDTFLITESTYGGNGLPKPALFDLHKHEPRFAKYLPQIRHVVDQKAPENTGRALGWGQTQRVKDTIGIELLSRYTGQDGVVFVSDMDEIPSVAAVEWARAHCCRPRETWTIDMPYFMYGLHWQALRTSKTTLTVRRMSDELEFWRSRQAGTRFAQTVVPLPAFVDPGVHCSYCTGVAENVQKLRHTNLVDGPPYLSLLFYDEALFAHMRACGVTPQGRNLERASVQVPAFSMYPYLSLRDAQTFGVCQDHAIPAREWPSVLPALKKNRRLHLFPVDV